MEQKAWIDVKSPRFFLEGYPIYWGACVWCETFDTFNKGGIIKSQKTL